MMRLVTLIPPVSIRDERAAEAREDAVRDRNPAAERRGWKPDGILQIEMYSHNSVKSTELSCAVRFLQLLNGRRAGRASRWASVGSRDRGCVQFRDRHGWLGSPALGLVLPQGPCPEEFKAVAAGAEDLGRAAESLTLGG